MKEYVRRVKATVEQSWLDDGESGEIADGEDAAMAPEEVAA